jgi:hypothetical protein
MTLSLARLGLMGGVESGGLQLIESKSFSGVAQVDFTSIKESQYDVHFVQMINMETTSTGHPQASKMQLRFSNDGGSSFESGSSAYAWGFKYIATNGNSGESKDDADTSFEISPRANSGEPVSLGMYIYGAGNSSFYTSIGLQTTASIDQKEFFYGGGTYNAKETINALRFYNAYNMTGTLNLYGVKQ